MLSRKRIVGSAAGSIALLAGALTVTAPQAAATDWSRCVEGAGDRQAVFARASALSGVPERVLLGVSYMQSRWDAHGGDPSTSGGYGPMHLSRVPAPAGDPRPEARGETQRGGPSEAGTLVRAAELTGLRAETLRTSEAANICGGAAVLASYQPDTTRQTPRAWTKAVAKYSGAGDEAAALRFAEQVFRVIRRGESRVTNDGHRVALPAMPRAQVDRAAVDSLQLAEPSSGKADCPEKLGCEWIPAPYEWYGEPNPYAYGNHDLASRPDDLDIDYIIVHNTEGRWQTVLDLVTDPTYVSWQYSLRSSDGHIAHHVENDDVAWHAGNWFVNMHSIGLEHEGFAAEGTSWYTETMYQTSATLVRYLAEKYDVPLDRAHIIGHDQIPGVTPAYVRGMHWDPGPYWDWEHYFDLLDAPFDRGRKGRTDVVTVAPGFEGNAQPITGCEDGCVTDRSNFVYLHTEPSEDSPLVKDVGLHPDGSHSTTQVWDIGARAAAGHQFLVHERRGDWLGVWYLGDIAWLKASDTVKARARVVVPRGDEPVPVYGRAYPEESAYPEEIPFQGVVPLQYSIEPGQAYVLAEHHVPSDYYYAKTYNDSIPGDHTVVRGEEKYHLIWFGHRMAYVQADDVRIAAGVGPRTR